VPLALDVRNQEVLSGLGRVFLAVLRVEIGDILRHRPLFPVDHPVEPHPIGFGFVGEHNPRRFAEGHRPIAVVGPAKGGAGHHGAVDIHLHAMARRKEVAQRRLHRRGLAAVPIDSDDCGARIAALGSRRGEPDMDNAPRPLKLRQHQALPRLDCPGIHISVFPIAVVARSPPGNRPDRIFQRPRRIGVPRKYAWGYTRNGQNNRQKPHRSPSNRKARFQNIPAPGNGYTFPSKKSTCPKTQSCHPIPHAKSIAATK